jgi:rhodanese-related sulfurtransferase
MLRHFAAAVAVGVLAVSVVACSDTPEDVSVTSGPTAAAAPENGAMIGAQDFAEALKREGTTILDVRTPAEFADGHLEGAVNMDVEDPDFGTQAGALDPAGTYAVYCRSGNRSGVAVDALVSAGFASVYHLAGGIGAWEEAGGDIVTE